MAEESEAPGWARSWVAMWVLVLAPILFYLLAGFNVGSFHALWKESWEGVATIMAIGLGVKFGKDTMVKRAEIQATASSRVSSVTFSDSGSD